MNRTMYDLLRNLLYLYFVGLVAVFVSLIFWEKGRRSLVLALRSLWLHKLRAFLSVLGIIIGTGAVILLMAFGEGSMQEALEDIKRMGATNIIVRSVKPPDDGQQQRRSFVASYGLTYRDFERFATIPTVVRMVPMRIFPQEARRLERMHNARVVGTTTEYAAVNKLEMASGRFLIDQDDDAMDNVCVLAHQTALALFPYDDPIGEMVQVATHRYKVIGVVKDRMPTGGTGGSQAAEVYNDDIYIPLRTCNVRFGEAVFIRQSGSRSGEKVKLHQVTLTVGTMDDVRPAGEVIKDLMDTRPNHNGKKDWVLTMPLDKLEEAERAKERFTNLLFVIGSISLFVGGIGIMNIMLATVTERTREIGIRRALGAKQRDITLQFLIESMVQTTVGGLCGVLFGMFVILAVLPAWAHWFGSATPAQLHRDSILLSLAVSVTVGMFFGLYPAYKASKMDPIEALRHE